MKKIALVAVGATLVTLASCSNNAQKVEANEQDLATKIENCTNPDSLKIYVDQAKDYAQKLIDEGKTEEAKKYLEAIEPVVEKADPSLSNVFSTIKDAAGIVTNGAANAVDSLENKAAAAGNAVVENTTEKVNEGKEAVKEAAQQAKDKATEVANEAKDKAANAVGNAAQQAKDKAAEAANSAADKIKGAFGK